MGTPRREPIPVLSLFCGAGGLDYGFLRAGFNSVLAMDREESAVATYNANLPDCVARTADLSRSTNQTVLKLVEGSGCIPRGVIGGPPCQGFSLGNTKASIDDPRNLMALRYCDLIREVNKVYHLDFFVFENVIGLRSSKHNQRLCDIKDRLDRAGFDVYQHELDAQFFGVPQRRRRLFLVGINRMRHPGVIFTFPNGTQEVRTVRSAIEGLPDPVYRKWGMAEGDVPYHPNHWTMPPFSKRFADQTFNGGRSFRRLDWERPSWTVAYGNREIHVHPDGKRRLTILEAMLLQKFPKKFVIKGNFSQQVQQVSNAVPPPVARAVASAIRSQLFNVQS
jgi:DNA (cytosine-5)-methyltransferase 1